MRRLASTLVAVGLGLGIGIALVPAVAASAATTQIQSPVMTLYGMQNPDQNGQNSGQNGQNLQQKCQNGTAGQNGTGKLPQCSVNLDNEASGPFSGASSFTFFTGGCSFVEQTFGASYTTSTGTGSFSMDGCSGVPTISGSTITDSFSGTFALTAPDGATLQGNVAGSLVSTTASPTVASLSFALTPTSGTNEFANATGSISLTGTWASPALPGVPGPISGSLSAALMGS